MKSHEAAPVAGFEEMMIQPRVLLMTGSSTKVIARTLVRVPSLKVMLTTLFIDLRVSFMHELLMPDRGEEEDDGRRPPRSPTCVEPSAQSLFLLTVQRRARANQR